MRGASSPAFSRGLWIEGLLAQTPLTGVCANKPSIQSPRENAGEDAPRIVGLPAAGIYRNPVTPVLEDSASATVGQRGQGEITECLLDARDQRDVVTSRARRQTAKVLAHLIALDH